MLYIPAPKFAVVFPVLFLLIVSIIPLVNATITKEYDEYNRYDWVGNKLYSFRVKMVVETEEDNTFLRDQYYQIDFIITLNYINRSIWSPDDHFIFYSPSLSPIEGDWEVVQNSTVLRLGDKGTVSLKLSPRPIVKERVSIKPIIYLNYVSQSGEYVYGTLGFWWEAQEIVYANVKSPTAPLFSSELFYMVAGIILGAVVIGTFFIVKTRKRKS